jgi:hypothetical protein
LLPTTIKLGNSFSVAVIQYLFTNHQAHLKDFITSLVKIDFDKNNQYDLMSTTDNDN